MRKVFPFEKLEVWQQSRDLAREIYDLAAKLPKSELFGLVSQLRRATVSVANNLAEGTSRSSFKEQAHFSSLSHGSLSEVACDLILAADLKFATLEKSESVLHKIYDLSIRIHNLQQSQLKRSQGGPAS